jgi:hypothetical protein
MTTPSSLSRLSEAPLIVVDGVTVWRPEDQEDPLIKIEVGGSVHVRKASEWHALAVASFALSESKRSEPSAYLFNGHAFTPNLLTPDQRARAVPLYAVTPSHAAPADADAVIEWIAGQTMVQYCTPAWCLTDRQIRELKGRFAPSATTRGTVLEQVEAALRKNPLIAMFLDQGFWHAHHVDVVIRQDGQDRRYEADWIKDIWYIVRRRGLSATEAVRAEQSAPPESTATRNGADSRK